MKPRIFISSTFYDLKYVREDISNFIKTHGFETVMFEDGDIGYTPGQPLDKSCYEAMKNSDMAILIIGGSFMMEKLQRTLNLRISVNSYQLHVRNSRLLIVKEYPFLCLSRHLFTLNTKCLI